MWKRITAAVSAAAFAGAACSAMAQTPIEAWSDIAKVTSVDMSRDGKRAVMLDRPERGEMWQVVTFDTDDVQGTYTRLNFGEDAYPIDAFWKGNSRIIMQFSVERVIDNDLERIPRFISFDVDTKDSLQLMAPQVNRRADRLEQAMQAAAISRIAATLPSDEDHIIMTQQTDSSLDYYKVNVNNGSRDLVYRGNNRLGGIQFDFDGEARLAQEYDEVGPTIRFLARAKGSDDWVLIGEQDSRTRDRFSVLGFTGKDRPNEVLVSADSGEEGDNYTNIYAVDVTKPDQRELLFGTEQYDSTGVIRSAKKADLGRVVGYNYASNSRNVDYYTDGEQGALYESITASFPDDNVNIMRISDDGQVVLFNTSGPQNPGAYYLIVDGRAVKIADRNPDIDTSGLAPMKSVVISARDGRKIPTYVTLPEGDGPFPGIVMPHGGPWVRDYYGYDDWAAMLGEQGYVVIQPNYRGSTELGKEHWIAGDREWGLAMQDDVEDVVAAAIQQGWVDPEKVGFFGWSYGGYSAFAAATRANGKFNCIVAGAGVADIGMIRGGLTGSRFLRQYQQPTIAGANPMENAEKVNVPMLLVHGEQDYTVPVEHSRRFYDRARAAGADIEYIEIFQMGHSPWFYRWNMEWKPDLLEFFDTKCGF